MGSCLSGEGGNANAKADSSSSSSNPVVDAKKKMISRRNDSNKLEMKLHRIPGRFFLNATTDFASLFNKQGKKGINQDAMILWENFGSKEDVTFCGVFDGHGPNGHMVAKKVRDSLPLKLRAHWELNNSSSKELSDVNSSASESMNSAGTSVKPTDAEPKTNLGDEHKENQTDNFLALKESFLMAFKVMDKELKLHPYIDCFCSGTTAVTLMKRGQDLVIGNVGDSRAVLGTRDKDDSLIAVQLTEDHKPNLPREAERIRLCKGRIFALPNEPEIARVWLPKSNSPGLAMSRSFGDFCLKDFGLISVPEFSYHHVTEKDEFVVLATDGLWDVLSNEEVVSIVASAQGSSAARTLVDSATRAWRIRFPTSKVDDCAAICLFLSSRLEKCCTSYFTRAQGTGIEVVEQVNLVNRQETTLVDKLDSLRTCIQVRD